MLPSELGHKRLFETPPKRVQATPTTIQQAPAVNRTELGQMATLMMSLGLDNSSQNREETAELVQNDALWMKEMMTVWKCTIKIQKKLWLNPHSFDDTALTDAHEMSATTNGAGAKAGRGWP